MDFENEMYFLCPYCAQQISMLLEELYGSQNYIEDCQVCCNPIDISYDLIDGKIENLNAKKAQ